MGGERLGPVDIEFFLKNLNIKEESQRIRTDIRGIGNTANDTNKIIATLGTGLGAYLSFQGLKGFGGELINVTGEFQKYEAVLRNSLGSQKAASDSMKMLSEKAATTPAQLSELADAYVRLVNQGFKPSANELTKLSDIASSTGKGIGQLAEAIIDAQTGEFERLKEFGIRASKEGDKVTFTFKGVKEQVDFTAESIQKYIVGLGDLNGVSGASAAIMGTLVGQISNLSDTFAQALNEFGQNNASIISSGINGLSVVIQNYKEIGDVLKVLVGTYGAYKAAVMVTVAWEKAKAASAVQAALAGRTLTAWEVIHTNVLYKLNAAQKLVNGTILANPYALAFGALAALIGGLVMYNKYSNQLSASQKAIAEVNKKAGDSFAEEKGKIDLLLGSARNQALTDKQRLEAIGKLKEIIPGYNAELSKEGKLINENTEAIEQYLKQLELKIKLTAVQDELGQLWKNEREQIKAVEEAEKNLARTRSDNNTKGDVFGGDIGISGQVSKIGIVNTAAAKVNEAKEKLAETRKVIGDLKNEYSNTEKDIANFFSGKTIETPTDKKGRAYELSKEIEALKKLQSELSNTKSDWDSYDKQIAAKQKELDAITGNKKEENKQQKDQQKEAEEYQKYLDELFKKTSSYEEKKQQLHAKYAVDWINLTIKGKTANVAELNRQYKEELDALEADNFKKVESYRWVFDQIEIMGARGLKLYISRLKTELEKFKGNEEVKLELTRKLAEAEQALSGKAPLAAIKNINSRLATLKVQIAQAKTEADKVKLEAEAANLAAQKGQILSEQLQKASGLLSGMGDLIGQFDSGLGNALKTAGELSSGLSSAIGAFGKGDTMGGITASLGILTTIVKLFQKDEIPLSQQIQAWISHMQKLLTLQGKFIDMLNTNEQISSYTDLIGTYTEQMDVFYKNASESIDRFSLRITATDLRKALKSLPESLKQWSNDDWVTAINAATGEAKGSLEDMYDQWIELQKQQKQYINTQNELITGTTYDSIVSSIVDGFADGYDSAADFASSFEELMRKALLQSLQVQYLEQPLQDWYNQFAAANKDGLSQQEIASLKAAYNAIITGAGDYAKSLEIATGITLGNAEKESNGTLSGAIQGMSQESADLLAGQFSAIRIHVADIAAAITGSFNNDLKSALNTDEMTNTFGLGLSTMNSTMLSMRDVALKANEHLAKIAANTNELAEIKVLLAANINKRGFGDGFTDRRIGGR